MFRITLSRHKNVVSPLLISAGLDIRLVICGLLGDLAETDP